MKFLFPLPHPSLHPAGTFASLAPHAFTKGVFYSVNVPSNRRAPANPCTARCFRARPR